MLKTGLKTAVIVLLFMLSIPLVNLYASGVQEETRIAEAEELVAQREYNSALSVLTELLRDKPEMIDEVQALLTQIRIEKDNYNDRYEELIATYGGDDVEAAYPLIKELEELDPNPNEATRISLVLARETAGFVFNNNRWVDIMESAALLIEDKEYSSAVEKYMEGFDLSRDIFRDAGYGNIVVNEIFARADEMNDMTLEFIDLYPQLQVELSAIETQYNIRSLDDFITNVDQLYPELERTAELRELLKDAADYYIVQEEILRTNAGDNKQVHYLIYMDRLLNGRTTYEELEGITGAIELYWNEVYDLLTADSRDFSEELFSNAVEEYSSERYVIAEAAFRNVIKSTESSIKTLEFGEEYLESDAEFARDGLLFYDDNKLKSELFYLNQEYDTAESFLAVIDKQQKIAELTARVEALDELSDNFRDAGSVIKEDIIAEGLELAVLLAESNLRIDAVETAVLTGEGEEKSLEVAAMPAEEYKKIASALLQTEIFLTAALFEIDLERLEGDYLASESAVNESTSLIQGVVDDNAAAKEEDLEFTVRYKYPDQALDKLLSTERMVQQLVADINAVDVLISDERVQVRTGAEVRAASEHSEDLMSRSRLLLEQAVKLADEAREQIFLAEKLKQEGERRIEESRTLTQRAQFTAAKERLEQAAAKFDESLSYLEDPRLRTYRDEEIPRLYEEIQVAENNLVVKQVREYLTQGKANYSQGNFPAAQNILIKAQSRWSDTNVEPNPEVEYWLTLTQTALSVTSGRIIATTDPLYAEMNQYLNQAREDLQKARDRYDRGQQSDADIYFERAEQSLLYVQQFFPFNEEARVLNLRISQYRDPERFIELFRSDFNDAKALISSNPQKAYIDLKDLAAINSNYPGLQAAITEAEYAAGIKIRPPDRQKLTRSTELYKLAFDIVSRNIRSEFTVALSYLNEAINLNPENNEAIRLKDRISTDVGGTATAVMSNADQQLYEQAVSEYTSGNYLKARILVENLLKNPVNQRNPKLLDLQERIERTR